MNTNNIVFYSVIALLLMLLIFYWGYITGKTAADQYHKTRAAEILLLPPKPCVTYVDAQGGEQVSCQQIQEQTARAVRDQCAAKAIDYGAIHGTKVGYEIGATILAIGAQKGKEVNCGDNKQ